MAKEAYYFSHDANARNDSKILSMRFDYGTEGYGMYWIIIECLREESKHKFKRDNNTYNALAMQMQCKPDAIKQFIEDCVYKYSLFVLDEQDNFYSESLKRRMDKYNSIKEQRAKAANARWSKQEESKCNANAMQNDANKRKLNEIKVNKIKDIMCVYEYYLTKDLIRHNKFTDSMKKAIEKALKQDTVEELKKYIDRHEIVVKATRKKDKPVKKRGIDTFFGQKAYQAQHLIYEEYRDGGDKWLTYGKEKVRTMPTKQRVPKVIKRRFEDDYPNPEYQG
jgi:hypothetical protein